jgi:uncharacterized membrane protein SpoIIM required for sporulation
MRAKKSLGGRFERYVKYDLTASVRRNSRLLAIVGVAFICFIALGAAAGSKRESSLGRAIRGQAEPRLERVENEAIGVGYGLDLAIRVVVNNASLALEVAGLGIGLGIYPAFVLALNGLVLGYLPFYVEAKLGSFSALNFLSLILPHGLIELLALVIAVACGLRLGIAAANALARKELEPLRLAGRDVADLLPASLLLLVVSGLVEGFISPLHGPHLGYAKIALGVVLFGGGLIWLCGWYQARRPVRARAKRLIVSSTSSSS